MKLSRLMELAGIFESPMDIDAMEHKLEDPVAHNIEYNRYMRSADFLEKLTDNISIFHGEQGKSGIYFAADTEKEKIYYVTKYRRGFGPVIKDYVYQSWLWIDKKHRDVVGKLPSRFFFELVDDFFTIVTDSEQTPDGKKFWVKRIQEAFDKKLNVYYHDFNTTELIQLHNSSDVPVFDKKYQIYSEHEESLDRVFVISKRKLK